MFTIAFTDTFGDLYAEPGIEPMAKRGQDLVTIKEEEMIPLPPGSSIALLPGRASIGRQVKGKSKKQIDLREIEGEQVFPAAAILPPGYTRTLLPAYTRNKNSENLPFFAYSLLAWKGENLYVGAVQTHKDLRWEPSMYNSLELPKKVKLKKKKHPGNRLLEHLEKCALEYKCFTAQNIFYERWEGGIPTSPVCNARCGGCISENRLAGTPSPQDRITFIPTVEEIVEVAVSHLENPEAIISFGQGCEGEPLMQGELILEAVTKIRKITQAGTINMNTNGSRPEIIEKLFDAGLDSVRVSLNSAVESSYNQYFRPHGYGFSDITKSIDAGIKRGKFVSLNFLHMPGVNDREEEAAAFFKFLDEHPVSMIQFRNLNIDPDYYFTIMDNPKGKAMGTLAFINNIREVFPDIKIGNFSIPVR